MVVELKKMLIQKYKEKIIIVVLVFAALFITQGSAAHVMTTAAEQSVLSPSIKDKNSLPVNKPEDLNVVPSLFSKKEVRSQIDSMLITNPSNSSIEYVEYFSYEYLITEPKYNSECLMCTDESDDPYVIAFTDHWRIVVVPNQSQLGRVVINSKRHFGSYEEMTKS